MYFNNYHFTLLAALTSTSSCNLYFAIFFENLVKITAKVINNAEKNYSRIQKGSNKTNLKASELGVY
ncbi:putative lipoprotein [Rickettsia amblyommatis str. Darkwater]|nr:putative lipoprotein [Rickettsia amblyommatis str. Darkwater]